MNYCDNCPAKLLAKNGDKHENIGNILTTVLFVLPKYKEEEIKALHEIYRAAFGKPIEEECNITYSIKCAPRTSYDISVSAIQHCKFKFWELYNNNNYKHTFVFGDAYKLFYNIKPERHIIVKRNNIDVHFHFYESLGIKYYSNTKYMNLKNKVIQDLKTFIQ